MTNKSSVMLGKSAAGIVWSFFCGCWSLSSFVVCPLFIQLIISVCYQLEILLALNPHLHFHYRHFQFLTRHPSALNFVELEGKKWATQYDKVSTKASVLCEKEG